jgi:hypothetical protein
MDYIGEGECCSVLFSRNQKDISNLFNTFKCEFGCAVRVEGKERIYESNEASFLSLNNTTNLVDMSRREMANKTMFSV